MLGLRLLLLSWWTPNYVIRRELEKISTLTLTALQSIVAPYKPKEIATIGKKQTPTSIKEQRVNMAQSQAKLVEVLVATIGHEEAVKQGRDALFKVGQDIGRQTRNKLGVTNNQRDLIKAAKILYSILGIDFHLEPLDKSNVKVIIHRCALAEQYSKLTCEVLSATDEGVIKGLQPTVTMKFREYMTSGCQKCIADIHFNDKETPPY